MFLTKPWWDALIVLLVVLLFFGPKRLPALGKSLGQGMREFKDSITGHSSDDDEDERPALTEASAAETTPAPSAPAETAASSGTPAESGPAEAQPAKVASSEQP